jgi:hypothetical protein
MTNSATIGGFMSRTIAIAIALGVIAPVSTARVLAQERPLRLVLSQLTDEVTPNAIDDVTVNTIDAADDPQAQPARPVAVEHSDAYQMRAKIHKYASFATLPLFATEWALGQSLFTNPGNGGRRTAHAAVGAGIGGLFAVNSVTGIWNMWESRSEPGHRLRLVHGILMLTADAGFVASAASAPGGDVTTSNDRSKHRTIAITSISVATVGYLIMLLGNN